MKPGDSHADRLIDFTFNNVPQDYAWFLSQPYWAEKKVPRDNAVPEVATPYTIDDAMDGLFLDRDEFERILSIWRRKKNLILQGAPGVGKSYMARRLALALMEEYAPHRIEMVQFHQSYGYEDFMQGYRPTADGSFELRDGVFHRFRARALADPNRPHVLIIDEINRGNLSKIFGELMLLIEHDKRSATFGTRLAYSQGEDEPFWVPDNLFILGLMNTADRSLSLVDYALRRRFAFVSLDPAYASSTFSALLTERGVPTVVISHIVERMIALNSAISDDKVNLGPGFRVGHSFFVPPATFVYEPAWLAQIVDTEIRPLLEEYWFDDPDKAAKWCAQLRNV